MKRYLHEKIAFVQKHRPDDEHVLIVPGAKNELTPNERSRIYSIRSPLVSGATQYRVLLDLRAIDEIIERELPDIIESGDPYQLGWKALRTGGLFRIPVVAFYHSHFAEAYLRGPAERLGLTEFVMSAARRYLRNLYNRYAVTLVPSTGLCEILRNWGVGNARPVRLGVNTDTFRVLEDRAATRHSLGIPNDRVLLLYVGRLAAEKNTHTLFDSFTEVTQHSDRFHLLVIGDGQQRNLLPSSERITWVRYCADPQQLACYYRAADLFVHPGTEEVFGLVALESQACGTAVVGIRGTFMDESILHEQADWADRNRAGSIADAIERMSARRDLNALGLAASKQVAERYAWPRVFAQLFSIYAEVIASYRGPDFS